MTQTRADRLRAYIEATAGKTSAWGSNASDCSSWPARWVEAERGIKLALIDYTSEAEGRALMSANGLDALWRKVLGESGIYETCEPQLGDVGIVRMSLGASGCIFGERGIAFIRGKRGAAVIGPGKGTIVAAFAI